MNLLFTAILSLTLQSPITIVKNNGDEIRLSNVQIYQNEKKSSADLLNYTYLGNVESIKIREIKRISFKEALEKKKGVTTYRVILVRSNNDKLEVQLNLAKVEGINNEGKKESLGLGSVDKISF
ncbi:hypothetical protein [Ekhidna sp.]|uniref:hypothetical protein n=1 Tax=Ekhidna sp. TaxID=2608089 RepID=UPI003B511602